MGRVACVRCVFGQRGRRAAGARIGGSVPKSSCVRTAEYSGAYPLGDEKMKPIPVDFFNGMPIALCSLRKLQCFTHARPLTCHLAAFVDDFDDEDI